MLQRGGGGIQINQGLVQLNHRPVQRHRSGFVACAEQLAAAGKNGRQRQLVFQRCMLQRMAQTTDLTEHAAAGAHGTGPQRCRPVHGLLAAAVHSGKARVNVFLPAEPLLHAVGHADHGKRGHLIGRQRDGLAWLGAVAFDLHTAVSGDIARQQFLHELRAAHGAKQIDQMLGLLSHQRFQMLALIAGVELDQIDKGIAIHAVQQAQQAHLFRLLPQRQRARHAHQMVAKRARLVPVLAHATGQHHRQQRRQIGIAAQPFLIQQGLGPLEQVGLQCIERQSHGHHHAVV